MRSIFLVEDDADISRALSLRLGAAGYRVTTAADGILAVQGFEDLRPDLVVLDVSMPGNSGFEVARRLREHPALAATPLIFITASKRPGLRERAERLGAIGFFEKPFDTHELLTLIGLTLGAAPPRATA